jgi:hypothetical protein
LQHGWPLCALLLQQEDPGPAAHQMAPRRALLMAAGPCLMLIIAASYRSGCTVAGAATRRSPSCWFWLRCDDQDHHQCCNFIYNAKPCLEHSNAPALGPWAGLCYSCYCQHSKQLLVGMTLCLLGGIIRPALQQQLWTRGIAQAAALSECLSGVC